MGGGDLNLKKSWHPHTMKNQEKVWKAEQAKEQEEQRLDDLRKEIKEERDREELIRLGESSGVLHSNDKNAKLEWMYKSGNDLINREEYLLGRKIDKSFETLQVEEQRKDTVGVKQPLNHVEHDCVPFSIREYRNVQSTEQVDLQRKTMEDPLMLIKQREIEARRKLLENPVRLKEIHRILKTEKTLKASKKTKKSKKSKKSKKKHKKRDSSESDSTSADSDSDKDLDKELAKRVKQLKGDTGADLSLSKLLDSKYKTISKELDKATKTKTRKRSNSSNSSSSESENSDDNTVERRKGNFQHRQYFERQRDQRGNQNRNRERANNHGDGNNRNRNRYQRSRTPENKRDVPTGRRRSNSTEYSSSRKNELNRNRREQPPNRRRSRSQSPREDRNLHRRNRSPSPREDQSRSRRSRTPREDQRRSRRSRSRSPQDDRRRKIEKPKNDRSKSRSPTKTTLRTPAETTTTTSSNSNVKKPKLTDEERVARLREMVENASWRESDRTEAVTKHREAYAEEEAKNQARGFDKNFINKQVQKAIANQSDIGTRIRANLNNIQRNSSAMDGNFARK